MGDGFLGRWARRKHEARTGSPLTGAPAEAAAEAGCAAPPAQPPSAPAAAPSEDPSATPAAAAAAPAEPAPPAPPTMQDVQALTAQSDFSRFAARDVAADVKNAALKKLFADPRYNVMDGMDVYIGDYSQPDPLPERMLRQLAGAAFLRVFDAPPAEPPGRPDEARDVADNPEAPGVAQSNTASDAAAARPDDADTDLQLQPDDALAARGAGPRAG